MTSAGGQTYLDVCPSLLNGSYLLPVAVNRPLVLNTKNLPPQVQCFIYLSPGHLPYNLLSPHTSYFGIAYTPCFSLDHTSIYFLIRNIWRNAWFFFFWGWCGHLSQARTIPLIGIMHRGGVWGAGNQPIILYRYIDIYAS